MRYKALGAGSCLALSLVFPQYVGATQTDSALSSKEPAPTQARLLNRVAIEDLIASYLYYLDHGATDRLADLFTDDAVFETVSGTKRGRAAIRDYYDRRSVTRTTRHVSTNRYIVFDDDTHAHSVYTLTYYMAEGAPPFPASAPAGIADYAEKFVRGEDGRWRLAYRKATPIFGFAADALPVPRK